MTYRTVTKQLVRQTVVPAIALMLSLSMSGCLSIGSSDDSDYGEDNSKPSKIAEIDESFQKFQDSQDDFYDALEQDRQDYIVQRAGELGISLDDPIVEKLLQPIDYSTYTSVAPVHDPAVESLTTNIDQASAPEPTVPVAEAPNTSFFWKEGLTAEEQALYDQWYGYLREGYQKIHLDMCYVGHEESFRRTWEAIVCDHPELFWIDTTDSDWHIWYYDDPALGSDLEHRFSCDPNDIPRIATEIDGVVRQFHDFVGADKEPSHVMTRALVWLSHRLTYDHDYGPQNQCVTSALLSDRTVCAGYGMAYKMLVNSYGIPCIVSIGYAGDSAPSPDGEQSRHLWDVVWIDGKWTCVDVTWADDDEAGYSWKYLAFAEDENQQRDVIAPDNNPVTERVDSLRDYGKSHQDELDAEYLNLYGGN